MVKTTSDCSSAANVCCVTVSVPTSGWRRSWVAVPHARTRWSSHTPANSGLRMVSSPIRFASSGQLVHVPHEFAV